MNIDLVRAIRADCQELSARFYRHLDQREYAALSEFFAGDGVWQRQGKTLQGPAAILAEVARRPATMITRHAVSNLIVDVFSEDSVSTQCYVTLYYADPGEPVKPPVRFTGPACVFTYFDELKRIDGAWKIARKWSTMDFTSV